MKIAVIGPGKLGRRHLERWTQLEAVEIVGIVTRHPDKQRTLADQYHTKAYGSIAEVLSSTDVDVFDICTPTNTHLEYVKEIAKAKKHIICEKPLALSSEDSEECVSVCEENGIQLLVGHTLRFFPEYINAREQILKGAIGRPGVIRMKRGVPHPPESNPWYADEKKSGGIFLDLGIHEFDWLLWTFGDVQRVMAQHVKYSDENKNNLEYGLVTLRMVDGTIVYVELSWAETKFHTSFELTGSKGMITYDHGESNALTLHTRSQESEKTSGVQIPKSNFKKDPYYRQLEHFLNCLRDVEEPIVTAIEAKKAVDVAQAVMSSAKSGQPVTLQDEK